MKLHLTIPLFLCICMAYGQDNQPADSLRKAYDAEMKTASNAFSADYYPNRKQIYTLSEIQFLQKIEVLKQPFLAVSKKYTQSFQAIDKHFIPNEIRDIDYFFDKMILDYPYFHENYTGNKATLSKPIQKQLDRHLKDFNNPERLSSKDFKNYVEAFLRHQTTNELKKDTYKASDNKRLDAYLNIIPRYFTNQACREFWQHHYLFAHLDNFGSKHTEKAVNSFLATCKNSGYTKVIDSIYTASNQSYKDHIVETYKTGDDYQLDLHIFLPDSLSATKQRPVMVYFHGGSWTEGTPEWDFYNGANYAKKGWVGIAVEYRIGDRHETTPFEAVKDAKTAIRWIRMNAARYQIDTNKIVASGNSAGGHLVLTTAMAEEINEQTDNLNYGASPNLLLINSGVFDLTCDEGTAWISKDLKDKTYVQKISPQQLQRKGLPPMLIVHGTNDQSVDYNSAKTFANAMTLLGNDIEFQTLEGAHHYIWYDRRFSGKLAEIRKAFLQKHGYE